MDPNAFAALIESTSRVRAAAWSVWGELDHELLTHRSVPVFEGGPRWPARREAFRVARRGGETLVATDGLADPFLEGDGPDEINGLGLELFAVTDEPLAPVAGSWLWDLVWQAGQLAAAHGGLAELIDERVLLSAELYGLAIPAEHRPRFAGAAGQVGVLLGLVEPPFRAPVKGPLSPIRLVNVKLLTARELELCSRGGDRGREELERRFVAQGHPQRSGLLRESVA
jgi:hypothetical protein